MAKSKYTAELKIAVAKAYLSGEGSFTGIGKRYGVDHHTVFSWVKRYREYGEVGFSNQFKYAEYTSDFKRSCVEAVLRGEGSIDDIVAKYNISDRYVLRCWILRYNANMELKDYVPKREVYMAETGRKTTLDERKTIAKYCIAHSKDYKGTAALYSVSYNQVYSWVKKYLSKGADGLVDNRGHHKADDAVDELEHLRREVQRLQRQLEDEKRTVALLKKVNELEGM